MAFESLESRVLLAVSDVEQYFVYQLNRARHAPATYQAERGLPVDLSYVQPRAPLAINTQLMNSSGFKSDEMIRLNYSGHTSVTGETPNQLVRRSGYDLPYTLSINGSTYGIGAVGNQVESLAMGPSTADEALDLLIVDPGVNPPGHRNHLLGIEDFYAAAKEIGVGHAYGASSYYRHYWTIHATQSNDTGPYLTGVVFGDTTSNRRFNAGEGLGGVVVTAAGPAGTFSTTSMSAGGWAMKVPTGDYIVTASGGGFSGTSSAAIRVGTDNREIDFISGESNAWIDFNRYVNAAPVLLTTPTQTLPPVVIGTADPRGSTVGSLLETALSDADPLASRGIAVTAATPGNAAGSWQYSLDGGLTWLSLGSPSVATATLLRDQDMLRFVPLAGSASGTASISYRGWDQTTGTAGSSADTRTPGGASAFSTAIATLNAATVVTNTAPVLAAGGGTLASITEDTTSTIGTTVSHIVGLAFSDVDPGTPAGIAITGVTGAADGTWFFSVDGGKRWTPVGSVTSSTAIPLRSADRLRFVPNANFNGTATVTYRGWDQSTGVAGLRVDLSATGLVGGSGAYSTGSAVATITVTPVNDAPVYQPGRSALRLKPVGAGTSFNFLGTTISDLLGNCVFDVDASAVSGIALIGLGNGGTYYWNTGGSSWGGGGVSPSFVTLLRATDSLGFAPNSGFTGESTVTFRLWDQTTGSAGFNRADLSNPSLSTGGTTAFGTDILTARIFVGSAGTAPTVSFGAPTRAVDGRTVDSVPLSFSRAVEGVDVGDFRLTCNGSPVSLAGATLTGSGTSFVLGNLGGATSAVGSYVLSLSGTKSGITDTAGNPLATAVQTTFAVALGPLPPTNITLSSSTTPENNGVGAIVGSFSSSDPNVGDSFTYTLVAGDGSVDNASFAISGNQLRASSSFNYESKSIYSIRVRSTDASGLYYEKNFTITVTNVNETPRVVTVAAASSATVTGATTGLSVLGADDAAEAALTYTWVATGPATVSFSANGTNAAKSATATFTRAGSYTFTVTITDAGGLTTTSSVGVTVAAALTSIVVGPATATLGTNATRQFTASGRDQFGTTIAPQPAFTWSVTGGGTVSTSGLYTAPATADSATVRAASGTVAGTAAVTVTVPPWGVFTSAADLGGPTPAGSTSFASPTYTVQSGGKALTGKSDKFHFASSALTGNGSIVVRVASLQNTGAGARAGIMFRDSTAANARYAGLFVTPTGGVVFQRRTTTGGTASSTTVKSVAAPVWLRLVRTGNAFQAYYSTSPSMTAPTTWTRVGSTTIVPLASTARVGLAATSGAAGTLGRSTMTGLAITGSAVLARL